MCGRFALSPKTNSVEKLLPNSGLNLEINNSYNICPSMNIIGITANKGYNISFFKWGLIPQWANNANLNLINARAETINQKPAFKHLLNSRRVLILATAYYEWQKSNSKIKVPYSFSKADNELFAFAGLYDLWKSNISDDVIATTTIITTEANAQISAIHHRMPVILDESSASEYLNPTNTIDQFLKPYPNDLLKIVRVSNFVNSPANNSIECLKPEPQSQLF